MAAHSLDGLYVAGRNMFFPAKEIHLGTEVSECVARAAKPLMAAKSERIVEDTVGHARPLSVQRRLNALKQFIRSDVFHRKSGSSYSSVPPVFQSHQGIFLPYS